MIDFLGQYYNYIKALHIIAVMAWMAGLLYLPRLFVYHAGAEIGSDLSSTLKIMEKKLFRVIMNPSMIAAWAFGILMFMTSPDLMKQGWMHAKLLFVIGMSLMHMVYARWRKVFAADQNTKSHVFYRYWNEVPAIFMIIIVIMAVAEPF